MKAVIILLFVGIGISGCTQETFFKHYDLGTFQPETARSMHVLDDGLLFLSRAIINDSLRTVIIKKGFDGDSIWTRIYSRFIIDIERSVVSDSILYATGYYFDQERRARQDGFTLFKFNLEGELVQSQKYDVNYYPNPPVDTIIGYGSSGPICYNDKVVVYGQIYELQTDTAEFFSRGLLIWYNQDLSLDTIIYLQPSHREFDIWDAHIGPDGLLTFLVDEDAPTTDPLEREDDFRYFVKFDKNGNRIWTSPTVKIDHSRRLYLSSTVLSNGDMLMYYENDNIGYDSFIVVSQNEQGEINWDRQLDPIFNQDSRTIYDITASKDGHILLSGIYEDLSRERLGPYICKLDRNTGELLWERVYLDWRDIPLPFDGMTKTGLLWAMVLDPDGNIYAIGDRNDEINQDILLMKLDTEGCLETDCGGFEQDVSGEQPYKNMFHILSNWYYQDPAARSGLVRIGYNSIQGFNRTRFEMRYDDSKLGLETQQAGPSGFSVEDFYLSEHGYQIYHLVDNDTLLLYDFDLEIGDYFESDYTLHTLEVIDIDTIRLLNEDYRKTWTLADPNQPELTLTWIEGIGTDYGMLWPPEFPTGDYGDIRLTCYYVYERLHYINEDIGGCFISDTEEATSTDVDQLNVFYPNPVSDRLSLYPDIASHYDRYAVHAVGGNTVLPEQNLRVEVIDVSQLDAGIYFLQLIANDRQVVKKFVKI